MKLPFSNIKYKLRQIFIIKFWVLWYMCFGYKIICHFICQSSKLLKNITNYIIVLNYPSNSKKQSEVLNYTKKRLFCYPCETNTGDGIAEHVCHNCWVRVGSGEVSMKPRRMPVSHLWQKYGELNRCWQLHKIVSIQFEHT